MPLRYFMPSHFDTMPRYLFIYCYYISLLLYYLLPLIHIALCHYVFHYAYISLIIAYSLFIMISLLMLFFASLLIDAFFRLRLLLFIIRCHFRFFLSLDFDWLPAWYFFHYRCLLIAFFLLHFADAAFCHSLSITLSIFLFCWCFFSLSIIWSPHYAIIIDYFIDLFRYLFSMPLAYFFFFIWYFRCFHYAIYSYYFHFHFLMISFITLMIITLIFIYLFLIFAYASIFSYSILIISFSLYFWFYFHLIFSLSMPLSIFMLFIILLFDISSVFISIDLRLCFLLSIDILPLISFDDLRRLRHFFALSFCYYFLFHFDISTLIHAAMLSFIFIFMFIISAAFIFAIDIFAIIFHFHYLFCLRFPFPPDFHDAAARRLLPLFIRPRWRRQMPDRCHCCRRFCADACYYFTPLTPFFARCHAMLHLPPRLFMPATRQSAYDIHSLLLIA